MYKDFVLKNKDIDILKFRIEDSLYGDYELTILEKYNTNKLFYPITLKMDDANELLEWIQERNIPKNRAFVNEILASLGLHSNDLIGILIVGKGLSLNDPYWIVDPDFKGLYKDYNLYENDFNKSVALIAYTGHGHTNSIGTVAELTTNGSLKKAWRRINGDVILYKGNVHGNLYTNHGNEAYAEYYAYQVAHRMGLNAIPYDLDIWQDELSSTCKLFTDIDTSFVPIARFIKGKKTVKTIVDFYKNLGDEFYQDFCSMMVFDALICNTDRHLNNFGVLVDNATNEIKCMAPLFDHGYCMFDEPREYIYQTPEKLKEYIKTLDPVFGRSFAENAKNFLQNRQKKGLRHILDYTIVKHDKYNLSEVELNSFNKVLQDRAKAILDNSLDMNQEAFVNVKKELAFEELDETAKEKALQEIKHDLRDFYGIELDAQNQKKYMDCFTFMPTYDRAGTCVNVEYIQNKDVEDVIARMNDAKD